MKSAGALILLLSAAIFAGGLLLIMKGVKNKENTFDNEIVSMKASCDIGKGACETSFNNLNFIIQIDGTPSALKPFPVLFSLIPENKLNVKQVTMSFSMKDMEMGRNLYQLIEYDEGKWKADVVLPVCSSGRRDWLLELNIATEKNYRIEYLLTL